MLYGMNGDVTQMNDCGLLETIILKATAAHCGWGDCVDLDTASS